MRFMLVRSVLMALIIISISACDHPDTVTQSLMDISGAPLKYDDSKASHYLSVASVCVKCSSEKQKNITKIVQTIHEIMEEQPETELIVFGETILGWYFYPDDPENYQRSIAEQIPGPATDSIGVLADIYDIYIAFGLGELKSGTLYNSQVLLNPDGEIEAIHRKYHLVEEDIKSGYTAYPKTKDNVTVVDIKGIKTGMIICADMNSYWLTKELIEEEVDLVIHSLATLPGEFGIDAVARQYNAWIIFANRYGKENDYDYQGTCYISDPTGTIRTGGSGKERYEFYRIGVY